MAGTVTGDILIISKDAMQLYPNTSVYPALSLFPGIAHDASSTHVISGDISISTVKVEGNITCVRPTVTGHIEIVRKL